MTRAQRTRILKVIKKNCTVMHRYRTSEGECVLGGMAVEAGISLPLEEDNKSDIRRLKGFCVSLSQIFDVTINQLFKLQEINDTETDVENRRLALKKEVKSWPVSQ